MLRKAAESVCQRMGCAAAGQVVPAAVRSRFAAPGWTASMVMHSRSCKSKALGVGGGEDVYRVWVAL